MNFYLKSENPREQQDIEEEIRILLGYIPEHTNETFVDRDIYDRIISISFPYPIHDVVYAAYNIYLFTPAIAHMSYDFNRNIVFYSTDGYFNVGDIQNTLNEYINQIHGEVFPSISVGIIS